MRVVSVWEIRLKSVALLITLAAWAPAIAKEAGSQESSPLPQIAAESAILMDVSTGAVLYAKNADVRRPPASLTKVMTALLVLEDRRLDDNVVVSPSVLSAWGSMAGLQPGDVITQRDLLYALLLKSANDACVASAEHIGGTVEGFVARMNQRAKELGAVHTYFANPNGLHDPTHLTTARDLAVIACYAMHNPDFAHIVKMQDASIQWQTTKGMRTLRLHNKNKLLAQWRLADGVKTGYTRQAGRCLIASATENGWQLLCVVMAGDIWNDSKALLKHGFYHFEKIRLLQAGVPATEVRVDKGSLPMVEVVPEEALEAVVRKGLASNVHCRFETRSLSAPVKRGTVAGWAIAENDGKELRRVRLLFAEGVPKAWQYRSWPYILLFTVLVAGYGWVRWKYGATTKGSRRRWRRLPSRR